MFILIDFLRMQMDWPHFIEKNSPNPDVKFRVRNTILKKYGSFTWPLTLGM